MSTKAAAKKKKESALNVQWMFRRGGRTKIVPVTKSTPEKRYSLTTCFTDSVGSVEPQTPITFPPEAAESAEQGTFATLNVEQSKSFAPVVPIIGYQRTGSNVNVVVGIKPVTPKLESETSEVIKHHPLQSSATNEAGSLRKQPSILKLQEMMAKARSREMPKIPTEFESLSTMIPTTQSQLHEILIRMASQRQDQLGMERVAPNKDHWESLEDVLPRFNSSDEFVGVERMQLVFPPIFDASLTTVFALRGETDKAVRYHIHCRSDFEPIDATVVDYWFLRRLESSKIVPKIFYYSAPLDPNAYDITGKVIPAKSGKTKTVLCEKAHIRPGVRFAIMEKVGVSVHTYVASQPGHKVPFTDAMRMAGQMIALAEKLHSYNIIHGDAHMGNFVIHMGKIIMIDFGRAKIMSPTELSDRHVRIRSAYWVSPTISPWEMKKHILSYRDDVYRIMHGIANCIYGNDYAEYIELLCDREQKIPAIYQETMRDKVIDMKLSGNIFEIPQMDTLYRFPPKMVTSFSLEGLVPDAVLGKVRTLLTEMMEEVMKVDVFSKPDYRAIKQKLVEILTVVEGTDSTQISSSEETFYMSFENYENV